MGEHVHVGTGRSDSDKPYEAGRTAVEKALKSFKEDEGQIPDIAMVFASSKLERDKLAKGVDESLEGTEWVGVTTAGEISPEGPSHGSCVVMLIESENMEFNVGMSTGMWKDAKKAGRTAMMKATTDRFKEYPDGSKFVIPFMPGMTVNPLRDPSSVFEAVLGIYEEVGNGVACAGGAAGDELYFKNTYQFYNGEVFEDAVIVVAVTSDLLFDTGVGHGCVPVEDVEPLSVDELKDNNVLSRLDGKKALERYAELMDMDEEELRELFELPTGAKLQKIAKYGGVLHPLGMDIGAPQEALKLAVQATEEGDIVFHDKLIEGSRLKLMRTDEELNIQAVEKALESDVDAEDSFSLMFNCAYRWIALGESTNREIDIASEYLDGSFAGFYTYGEVGYPRVNMPSYFGYTTTTLTVFDKLREEDD